jgi:hypothetical protein
VEKISSFFDDEWMNASYSLKAVCVSMTEMWGYDGGSGVESK